MSGAARFLDRDRAQIILSARYLADDHFWFTFFHEAGHLLKHDAQAIYVDQIENGGTVSTSLMEKEADAFASLYLVPEEVRQLLDAFKRPSARQIAMAARREILPQESLSATCSMAMCLDSARS